MPASFGQVERRKQGENVKMEMQWMQERGRPKTR